MSHFSRTFVGVIVLTYASALALPALAQDPVPFRPWELPSWNLNRPERPFAKLREAAAQMRKALPGGRCPGAPAGSEARKRDPDPGVMLSLIRECYGGNGSSPRD
jgi:hypothetical protein